MRVSKGSWISIMTELRGELQDRDPKSQFTKTRKGASRNSGGDNGSRLSFF